MSDDQAGAVLSGTCLCGAVSLHVQHPNPSLGVCHCGICRTWTGGPFMTLESHQAPRIEGGEHVRTYASSDWAERGFCMRCGTHLFYRLREGEFYALAAGLFEEGGQWPFELQVFIDEKPENYAFANVTREMTGEEVFKAWS
ncbi:MAG: GFA family protein [Pigmentiphaga sp.]